MKHSITTRLFALLCALAVIFISVLSMLNLFFYDDYELWQRKQSLKALYGAVHHAYDGSFAPLERALQNLENTTGVRISVFSARGVLLYDSIFKEAADNPAAYFDMPLEGAVFDKAQTKELDTQGYTFVTLPAAHAQDAGFLALVGKMGSTGGLLVARVPLSYLEQNSSFNFIFLVITGFFTLVCCILLAIPLARRLTRPLLAMETMAEQMAKLDFSISYQGQTEDEIGKLGNSLNLLSQQLRQAIEGFRIANTQLSQELKEKEEAERLRRTFLTNVSHELKTPLAIISGYAEGLRAGVATTPEDVDFYCTTILDESIRMHRLVMRLMELSRLELGTQVPHCVWNDTEQMLLPIVQKMEVLEKRLVWQVASPLFAIYADTEQLMQVLENLVSNATMYTEAGGDIAIGTEKMEASTAFWIENTSQPIEAEALPHLFEQFYRTDVARSRTTGGTGLGLSIVRAIVHQHGGSCWAENTEKGVRFTVTFPNEKDRNA